MMRRGGGMGARGGRRVSTAPAIALADQIEAILGSGASGGAQALFRADAGNVAHTAGKISAISDELDIWPDVTQGSANAQPTFDATLFGGRGGVTHNASHYLQSSAVDLTAFERGLIIACADGSVASFMCLAQAGGSGSGTFAIYPGYSSAGRVAAAALQGAGHSRATAITTLTPACVIEARADYTLASDATSIWKNGADVTSTRPLNSDLSAGTLGNGKLSVGDFVSPGGGWIGSWRSILICAWPSATAFPNTAIARARALLAADAGIAI